LTVVKREGSKFVGNNGKLRATWLCRCNCSNEIITTTICLTTGATKSCGCIRKEHPNSMRHGASRHGKRSKAFQTWIGIRARCCNPNEPSFKRYGGRGITVCSRWLESFENFLEDMGEPENPELQLDRINNNLGYSKENCRWTTSKVNGRNKSNTIKIEGITLAEAAENNNIGYHRLYHQVITRKHSLAESIAKLTSP